MRSLNTRFAQGWVVILAACGVFVALADAAAPEGVRAGSVHVGSLQGCAGRVAVFSPDGKFLLTTGGNCARLWDPRKLKPVAAPMVQDARIWNAGWTADSSEVFTAGGDEVRIWNGRTGAPLKRIRVPLATIRRHNGVVPTAISPDGLLVVTASKQGARVWDTRTGKLLRSLKEPWQLQWAGFSRDAKKLVTFNIQPNPRAPPGAITHVWDPRTGRELIRPITTDYSQYGQGADISPDGKRLAVASMEHFTVFDIESQRKLCDNLGNHMNLLDRYVDFLRFTPNGSAVIESLDGIRLYDSSTGRAVSKRLPGLDGTVYCTPDAMKLLSGGSPEDAGIWDIATAKRVQAFGHDFVWSAALSPDGKLAAVGYVNRKDETKGHTDLWSIR